MSQPNINTRTQEEKRIIAAGADYYKALNLNPSASESDIKRAIRQKYRTVHPDKGGDVRAAQILNEAAVVLLSAEKRREYDQIYQQRSSSDFAERVKEIVNFIPKTSEDSAENHENTRAHTNAERAKNRYSELNHKQLNFEIRNKRVTIIIAVDAKKHQAYIHIEGADEQIKRQVHELVESIFLRCQKLVHPCTMERETIAIDISDYDSDSTLKYYSSMVEVWATNKVTELNRPKPESKKQQQSKITVETKNITIEIDMDKGTLRLKTPGIMDRNQIKVFADNVQDELLILGFDFTKPKPGLPVQGPYSFTFDGKLKVSAVEATINRVAAEVFQNRSSHRRHM